MPENKQGRIQDFHLGGGGGGGGRRKRLCARTHITSAKPEVPIQPGSRACLTCLRALELLGCWCSLVLSGHSDTQWDLKTVGKPFLFGGGGCSGSATHWQRLTYLVGNGFCRWEVRPTTKPASLLCFDSTAMNKRARQFKYRSTGK